jgi:DNA-binding LacI/PurR family transcriptional regulator
VRPARTRALRTDQYACPRRPSIVPDDLSILAVCPSDVAFGQPVRLSSIDVPGHPLGAIAVEMVMDQLAGRREPETRLLAPKLTERDSCGSPPASRDTTRRS